MANIYFPSCNFAAASPETARRIRAYLEQSMAVAGCCRTDGREYPAGDTAVYFCQACRETIESKPGNGLHTENLFMYLERDESFPWPDYRGLTVNVQDCWRDREHPEIFDAVRGCLQKMGVAVAELEENRERSSFCGDLHLEPQRLQNRELLARYDGTPIMKLPPEVKGALMLEQAEKYTCPLVVCYCSACLRGINLARSAGWQGTGVHLLELAMGTYDKAAPTAFCECR